MVCRQSLFFAVKKGEICLSNEGPSMLYCCPETAFTFRLVPPIPVMTGAAGALCEAFPL